MSTRGERFGVEERPWRMLVDGCLAEAAGGATYPTSDPATGRLLANVPSASVSDVGRAVAAAERGGAQWRRTPARERANVLRRLAAQIRDHWAAGQSCGSTSRLLVHRSLVDEVTEAVVERTCAVRVGDPVDPGTEMGCLVSETHRDRVMGFIDRGRAEGLRLATGGRRSEGDGLVAGSFVEPTVFAGVPPTSALAREEIFGPVLVVIPFDTEMDAVEMANASNYGLTASIWTKDLGRAHRLARAVEAGYVWINTASRHFAGLPFGGVKDSGLGREEAEEEVRSFTQTKAVSAYLGPHL